MGVRETKSLHIYLSTYLTCKLQVFITARDHLLVTSGLLSCRLPNATLKLCSGPGPKTPKTQPSHITFIFYDHHHRHLTALDPLSAPANPLETL